MIQFYNDTIPMPEIRPNEVRTWLKSVAADYGKKTGNINYIFCGNQKILEVNKKFLHHDYYTDVITFDYTTGNTLNGDIFISLDTVTTNAAHAGCSFDEELHRILVHGLLHLCGQNDKTPETRSQMTIKENLALAKIFPSNLS